MCKVSEARTRMMSWKNGENADTAGTHREENKMKRIQESGKGLILYSTVQLNVGTELMLLFSSIKSATGFMLCIS